jgi:hypothetical protein
MTTRRGSMREESERPETPAEEGSDDRLGDDARERIREATEADEGDGNGGEGEPAAAP